MGTGWAAPTTVTLRVKSAKIAAAVIRNRGPARIWLASRHPLREVFASAARPLTPS